MKAKWTSIQAETTMRLIDNNTQARSVLISDIIWPISVSVFSGKYCGQTRILNALNCGAIELLEQNHWIVQATIIDECYH